MAGELSQCVLTLSAALVLRKNKTIEDGGITIDFWIIKVHTTRCQILCSMPLHCVSKTLTLHRMH